MAIYLKNLPTSPAFIWPVQDEDARISSPYGCRAGSRKDARCPDGQRVHNGIDIIANDREAPIYAIGDGTVVVATPNDATSYTRGFSNYGRVVVVKHGPKFYSLYAHLSAVTVHPGQIISKGTQIGKMGRTAGNRDNPDATFSTSRAHLHFEISPRPYPQGMTEERGNPVYALRWGPDFFTYFRGAMLRNLYNLPEHWA